MEFESLFLSAYAPSVVLRYVYLFKAHHVLHGLLTHYSTREFYTISSRGTSFFVIRHFLCADQFIRVTLIIH